jgi:hypothetical protein
MVLSTAGGNSHDHSQLVQPPVDPGSSTASSLVSLPGGVEAEAAVLSATLSESVAAPGEGSPVAASDRLGSAAAVAHVVGEAAAPPPLPRLLRVGKAGSAGGDPSQHCSVTLSLALSRGGTYNVRQFARVIGRAGCAAEMHCDVRAYRSGRACGCGVQLDSPARACACVSLAICTTHVHLR